MTVVLRMTRFVPVPGDSGTASVRMCDVSNFIVLES